MSAPFFKKIQIGATADLADAAEGDPGLVSARDAHGVSPLLWSIYCGQTLARDFLVARLHAQGIGLDIFEAAALGDESQVRSLLQEDPERSQTYSGDGWTPLHLAAAFGTAAAVSTLLKAGAPVGAVSRNPQQNQPLHAALGLSKNMESIRLLLDQGASVNATQAGGFTPIFSAAIADRRDLVELLLAHGADPTHRSDQGKTASQFARERGHEELALWLESQPTP